MKKSSFTLLIAIAAIALVISFLVQRRAAAALRLNAVALQHQQDEIARTTGENQRLSNRIAQAADTNNRAPDYSAELAQLQTKTAALHSQENQLSNQLWNSRVSAGARLLASEDDNLTNHSSFIGASVEGLRAESRLNDAMAFIAAIQHYTGDHQGMFPLSLDQVTSYLPRPLDHKSDFEIVYQGGTNELANIPLRRVALIRERQPWLTPDGKSARTYGYADGAAEIITSDDNFQSWDAMHVIPPSDP